jgi:segregation and condensation protein B
VAYFQPITRAEVSAKRGGVDAGPALKLLLERGLIK